MKAATKYNSCPIWLYGISIHAAREGGDLGAKRKAGQCRISIHAAREGGDDSYDAWELPIFAFQSTPPVKAATRSAVEDLGKILISIHAAREGGDRGVCRLVRGIAISIHAAREGGDIAVLTGCTGGRDFNPRRP